MLRGLRLAGGKSVDGVGFDLGVLLLVMAALVAIGGRLYPRIAT